MRQPPPLLIERAADVAADVADEPVPAPLMRLPRVRPPVGTFACLDERGAYDGRLPCPESGCVPCLFAPGRPWLGATLAPVPPDLHVYPIVHVPRPATAPTSAPAPRRADEWAKSCERCGDLFTRPAGCNNARWRKRRFCSISCASQRPYERGSRRRGEEA